MIRHLLLLKKVIVVLGMCCQRIVKFEQIDETTCHVLFTSRIDLLKVFQNILTHFR